MPRARRLGSLAAPDLVWRVLLNPFPILARLPPVVRLLVAGTFVNKLGSFIVPFLTIVLRREFGLDEKQVGWLLLAYGAGSLTSVLGPWRRADAWREDRGRTPAGLSADGQQR